MFESIVYRNAIGHGPLIDIGALAEGLIFYGRVAIVGDTSTIKDLLRRVPPFIILSLLQAGRLEFHYLSDKPVVLSSSMSNGRSLHNLVCVSSPDHTIEKIGPRVFKDVAGDTSQARFGASKFVKLLKPLDHSAFDQTSVLEAISDGVSTNASVASLVRTLVPDYECSEPLRFKVDRENQGFYVDTNIDFVRLNEIYHKSSSPAESTFTEAYILGLLQTAYESTYYAAALNSEIAVTPIEKIVHSKAVEAIVNRHRSSESQIENFVDFTLADAKTIREAVNSGAVPFASVVKLLDSADKFRHWLRVQSPDSTLLQAFYQETIKNSWAEKLPAKSVRWGVFTGIGIAVDTLGAGGMGTAIGAAISAVDGFLVDKMIQGWKPHQFVEGELKPLFAMPRQQAEMR